MPLILAIEPDKRQATQLRSIVKAQLEAELVLADSAERALAALGDRIPDLILTSALLLPKDEMALHERLRSLAGAASHVQTLTIPVLAAPQQSKSVGGMLSSLRRGKSKKANPTEGCDPAVFAEQCAEYLERARAERAAHGTSEKLGTGPLPKSTKDGTEPPVVAEPAPTKQEASFDTTAWADSQEPDPAPHEAREYVNAPGSVLDIGRAPIQRDDPPSQVIVEPTSAGWAATRQPEPVYEPPPIVSSAPVINRTADVDRLQAAEDDSEDLEETYEIDLGDLTEDEPLGTGAGRTRDAVWQTGNSLSDDTGVQAYDINVDELFADADLGLAKGVAPALGGRSARTSEVRVDAPIAESIPAAATRTPIHATVEGDSAHSGNGMPLHQGWPSPGSGRERWPTADENGGRAPSTFIEDPAPITQSVSPNPEGVRASATSSGAAKQSGRPEWLDMVESLRHDVQQLQTDWGAPSTIGPNLSVSQLDEVPDQTAHFGTEPAALPASTPAPEKPRGKSKNHRPAKKKKHPQDEWGFFDPEQCGFAALLTKLEEITDDDPTDFHS
jgi:hypothetical protein